MDKNSGATLKMVTTVTFLVMIVANALANILPLNGITTGEVSDSYPNLFAPAGITFSIWGVIYLLLAGYILYQHGVFQKNPKHEKMIRRISVIFSISSLANSIWIFAWHYRLIPLTMILMLVILLCLIIINQMTYKEKFTLLEKVFIKVPFSVYFGWITIATIANLTTLLVDIQWNRFGLSEPIWMILTLAAGVLIGGATMLKHRNMPYGLVLIWAYGGIWLKHTSETGFKGQYFSVIAATLISLCLFLIAEIYLVIPKREKPLIK